MVRAGWDAKCIVKNTLQDAPNRSVCSGLRSARQGQGVREETSMGGTLPEMQIIRILGRAPTDPTS